MIDDNLMNKALEGDDDLQIICNTHNLALQYVEEIKEVIKKEEKAEESISFDKLERIVSFFSDMFSKKNEGELTTNLLSVYDHTLMCLILVKRNNDLEALNEAERMIKFVKSVWEEDDEGHSETTH